MEENSILDSENKIIIKYKIDKYKKTKIFGKKFVIYNNGLCKMIINNKEYDICETFSLNDSNEIILINIHKIKNISSMFESCHSLLSLLGLECLNTYNFNDMSYLFNGCESLVSLPDISKWNTSNVTNMESLFSGCTSLLTLPDLSKWDTSNVANLKCLFSECKSLLFLPDLSKWNTSNVNNLSFFCY